MRPHLFPFIFTIGLLVLCSSSCGLNTANQPDPATKAATKYNTSRFLKLRGSLKDSQKHRLTGVFGVMFAIYDQQAGGAPLWMEVQNVEADEHSRYSIVVGSTKSEGIQPELFGQDKTLWLGMQVSLPGEVEQPRFKLEETSAGLRVDRATKLVFADDPPDTAAKTEQASNDTGDPQKQPDRPIDRPAKPRRQFPSHPTP